MKKKRMKSTKAMKRMMRSLRRNKTKMEAKTLVK